MAWRLSLLVLVWVSWLAPQPAWAGKLQAIRNEVRGKDTKSAAQRSSSRSSARGSVSDNWESPGSSRPGSNATVSILVAAAEERMAQPEPYRQYERYPYHRRDGFYVVKTDEKADRIGPVFSGSVGLEGAYLGDSVWRSRLQLDLSLWRLSLLSDVGLYLEEPLVDALYLGSTHLAIALLLHPKAALRVGGGVNYMIDGRDPRPTAGEVRDYAAGGGGTIRLDVFPVKPLVLAGRFDYGTVYNARTLTFRTTLGAMIRRFEFYGGYELRAIGEVVMNGPVAGLRVRF